MATTAIFGLKKAVATWTPPFGTVIPICDINIWQHQNDKNYIVAVAVWMSSKFHKGSFTLWQQCQWKFLDKNGFACNHMKVLTWWRHCHGMGSAPNCDNNGNGKKCVSWQQVKVFTLQPQQHSIFRCRCRHNGNEPLKASFTRTFHITVFRTV